LFVMASLVASQSVHHPVFIAAKRTERTSE